MPKKRKSVRLKNPTTRRRTTAAKRKIRSVSRRMTTFNYKSALANAIPIQIGFFASKWAAKKWSTGGATETDPESWSMWDYVKGALGSVGAGMVANMVKPGWGQKVFEGGFHLMLFKALENEVIQKNEWAKGQFGEDYVPTEYLMSGYGEDDPLMFGGYGADDGDMWGLSEDGDPIPLDDRHRLPMITQDGYGAEELIQPGPLGQLEPVGHMGGFGEDPYITRYHQ